MGIESRVTLIIFLWAGFLVVGCSDSTGPSTDSQTHWMETCNSETDCDDWLVCHCGLCTLVCEDRAACSSLGEAVSCIGTQQGPADDICLDEPSESPGVCLPSCQSDSGCEAFGGGVCTQGVCVGSVTPPEFDVDADASTGETSSDCPVARPQVRLTEVGGQWHNSLEAAPQDVVDLDAATSSVSGGSISEYEWTISDSPPGSAVELVGSTEARTSVGLDIVGRYEFDLTVTDDQGQNNCDPASTVVTVAPDTDIYIELVGGAGAVDGPDGPRLELHLVHPSGSWNEFPTDCTIENRTPDWGDSDSSDDDPVLDVPGGDVLVPTTIRLDKPEGGVYQLGVLCTAPAGTLCPSRLRVYLSGEEPAEMETTALEGAQFWEAGAIRWLDRFVSTRGRIINNGIP